MFATFRSATLAAVSLFTFMGLILSVPNAHAQLDQHFANHVAIYSGNSYQAGVGFNQNNYTQVSTYSDGTAWSGTWIANSSGTRVSQDNYCSFAPGCEAEVDWPLSCPCPSGYPVAHNHGNASPSFFEGYDVFWG
jgi:hypothetical protein